MHHLKLTSHEVVILKSAARRGDPDEEFQALLSTLASLVDANSGRLLISQEMLERIQHYGAPGGSMTRRAAMTAIFRRPIKESPDQNSAEAGHLTWPDHPDTRGL